MSHPKCSGGPRYERLTAWKSAHAMVLALYRLTAKWPGHERYALTSQTRRAAVSSAANLVEGTAKFGPKECARFVAIAHGSLCELHYLLRLAHELGYLTADAWREAEQARALAGRQVWGLLRKLRATASVTSRPRNTLRDRAHRYLAT